MPSFRKKYVPLQVHVKAPKGKKNDETKKEKAKNTERGCCVLPS